MDALYEECEEQMTRMEEEEKKLGENLEKYEKGLLEYDPMSSRSRSVTLPICSSSGFVSLIRSFSSPTWRRLWGTTTRR